MEQQSIKNSVIVNGPIKAKKIQFTLPGDKSIAHRSLIIGTLPEGEYNIYNFPKNEDCLTTLECIKKLGVEAYWKEDVLKVKSPGYKRFNKNIPLLDAQNSGTTARLISGVLSSLNINTKLIGDSSLSNRPMKRVINPLNNMGANLKSENGTLPIEFCDNNGLTGITYEMSVASAQVKSCILIAGFLSYGETKIIENTSTRNHTEIMFKYLEADIKANENYITIRNSSIISKDIYVPGDISSAAYIIACAILGDVEEVIIDKVLLNYRRRKYIDILKKMGANIEYEITSIVNGEELGCIKVYKGELVGIEVPHNVIPDIIDEIPILSVIAAFSKGTTIFRGVEELKYKESNRILGIVDNLNSFGINCIFDGEDLIINGQNNDIEKTIVINPKFDHRIALSFLCAALKNKGVTTIENWNCTEISFSNALSYFKDFIRII